MSQERQARSESPFLTSTVLRSFLSFSLSKSCLDGKRRPQRLAFLSVVHPSLDQPCDNSIAISENRKGLSPFYVHPKFRKEASGRLKSDAAIAPASWVPLGPRLAKSRLCSRVLQGNHTYRAWLICQQCAKTQLRLFDMSGILSECNSIVESRTR